MVKVGVVDEIFGQNVVVYVSSIADDTGGLLNYKALCCRRK